ncbi:hypothetical protein ABZU76_01740 [Amycolatopsis sp. NPDC005232]|uniref:hypothetical protein n=1 Tax=Amycolatopsis sp. NPDC005232 TaxID=3157027 RepID=UPI0033A6816B
MRWLTLYARSRRLPASLAALVLCPIAIRILAGADWSVLSASLALGAAIAVAATGLSGQDVDLDRTAAFGWFPRRLVHLVLLGLVAVGVLLLVRASVVPASVIVRDGLGLVGLAGLAAFAFGGQFGWTLPLLWLVLALFAPPDPAGLSHVLAWPLQPSDVAVSWWLAGALFLAGAGVYSAAGARR